MDHEHGNPSSKDITSTEFSGFEVETHSRHESLVSSSSDSSQGPIILQKDALDKSFHNSKEPAFESQGIPSNPKGHRRVSFMSSPGGSVKNHPYQYVDLPPGYDPNRIPSSVFSSKPTNPMEWSVASNESLFSIQMGNSSFPRDHVFMLHKSGDLTSEQFSNFQQVGLPTVNEAEHITTNGEHVEISEATETSTNTTTVADSAEVAKDKSQEKRPPAEDRNSTSNSISPRSDGSNNSTRSFAFPLLMGGEDGRNNSVKVSVKNQESQDQSPKQSAEELQPQTPSNTPKATNSWFSWFYCCPLRCS